MGFRAATRVADENARGEDKIGTTGRGIGPAYEDKVARRGIRIADLRELGTLRAKLAALAEHKNFELTRLHDALVLAHEVSHPYSLTFAQVVAGMVSQWCRDVPAVHEHTEAAVALSTPDYPLAFALSHSS